MSWSLRIRNGDLALGGARYDIVTGHHKLVQDLRLQLLERMGTDPSHPGFGSLLDGGRLPNGDEIPGPIGQYDWDKVMLDIEVEIRRIEREHQARQQARIDSDRNGFRNMTLTADEVLTGITGIDFQQVQDTLFVEITLRTATDLEERVSVPVGTTPVAI